MAGRGLGMAVLALSTLAERSLEPYCRHFNGRIVAKKKFRAWLALSVAVLWLALFASVAADPAGEALERGWRAYHGRNFAGAEEAFRSISGIGSEKDRLLARLGLAMVEHFRMPGARPDLAIPQYEALLNEAAVGPAFKANLHILLGEAHLNKEVADPAKAEQHYALARSAAPDSLFAREAVLRLARLRLRQPTEQGFRAAVAVLEEDLTGQPGNPLAGTQHLLCAQLLLALSQPGDVLRARAHLQQAYAVGLVNQRRKGDVLFAVAAMSEQELGDPETALRYYQLLLDSIPTDYRMYYAKLRVAALKEGR